MGKKFDLKEMHTFRIVVLVLLFAFYFGIALFDGPVWCVDSPSYTEMNISREPVYPLFLDLFRRLFAKFGLTGQLYGQDAFLFGVIMVQSLLWVYAAYKLGVYVARKLGISLGYLAVFFQVAVSALNRFFANRGSMYSECIMTEALAMPLFVIATVYIWQLFEEFSALSVTRVFLMTVLIASIRKQMLIVMLTWIAAAFIIFILDGRTREAKNFAICLVLAIVAFVGINELDKAYNYAIRGVYVGHTGNAKGAVDTLMYTAEEDTKALFDEYEDSEEFPQLKTVYSKIYDTCVQNGYVIEASPDFVSRESLGITKSDWLAIASHYADGYDHIGFDVLQPYCDEYVYEHFPDLDFVHHMLKEDQVESEIMKVLLKYDLKKIFTPEGNAVRFIFVANVLKAFIISNANTDPRILVKASAAIYILFAAIFIFAIVKDKRRVVMMSLVVILGLAINCFITGSMIFPQPRYMCYSMGLFYLTMGCGILYR